MASRGVHFAITPTEMECLLAAPNDVELMKIIEALEEAWDTENLAQSDKAWNAIHRCLTDGSLLYDSGSYPLNHVICGGRALYKGDDYTISLVTPCQVRDVSAALTSSSEPWLRDRYYSLIDPKEYDGDHGEDDFEYTWEWFQGVCDLFKKASATGRAVIFTVDA